MTTTSDTPDLDEKKQTTSQNSTQKMDFKGFFISLLSLLIILVIYFSFSGFNLYATKLAQSNVLPTDINCSPYTQNASTLQRIISNIFYCSVPSSTSDPTHFISQSMKLQFDPPPEKHILIDMLRKQKAPNQHFLANYLISLIERLLQFNYSSLNMYFNSLNSLPETAIVITSPIITGFYMLFMLFIELFYFIFLWFQCMNTFFQSVNDKGEKIPISLFGDPVNYMISIGFVILFIILLFMIVAFIPIINVGILIACLLSFIGYVSHFLGTEGGMSEGTEGGQKKKATTMDIMMDTFKYYKGTIATLFSLFFINNVFQYLGSIPGMISVLVAILLYFQKLGIPFYQSIQPNMKYLSKIIETHQAEKKCAHPSTHENKVKGFFQSFFGNPSENTKQTGGTIDKIKTMKLPTLDKKFLESLQTF